MDRMTSFFNERDREKDQQPGSPRPGQFMGQNNDGVSEALKRLTELWLSGAESGVS